MPLSRLRRFVLLGIILLFLLQFFRVKVLVGGLTGSLAVWSINFLDVFAYLEGLAASMDFTVKALVSTLPVLALYLVFGRAFCGWVCPMDFLYETVDRLKAGKQQQEVKSKKITDRVPPKTGYAIALGLLIISGVSGIPFFTNYLSHLTNFFRAMNSAVFLSLDLPADRTVLMYSAGVIGLLLLLEFFFPRLWCRALCPIGKTYGLFNRVSLLRLKFKEGECGECILCEQKCYMRVGIARYADQPALRDTNCIYCGRCAEGCGTKGGLIKMTLRR